MRVLRAVTPCVDRRVTTPHLVSKPPKNSLTRGFLVRGDTSGRVSEFPVPHRPWRTRLPPVFWFLGHRGKSSGDWGRLVRRSMKPLPWL